MSNVADAACPNIMWAQRPEFVLVSVPLQDATDVVVEIRGGRTLHFAATSDGQKYACAIELFREVASEESRHITLPRQIELKLKKRQLSDACNEEEATLHRAWPRLTRDKERNPHIQVDWSRWKDDDDEGADDGEDGGGLGMDYGDLMSQMMAQKDFAEAESTSAGSDAPGQEASGIKNNNINTNNNNDDDDYDDLPPLEE
ncbi:hypothetical protein DQ04_00011430 [Trypanosoma grayi]|uniref:hypothetical protein n=1 Tax=Trypanosoma grayi TaxID=71804 RepID=UPI0004F45B06|nr:hypothetical protein DQ04_00011430 [Trypanosoma grayi]KEG15676.1 hypothetical protein DQ04_00011430 [Trypanosoma grayi]